MRKTAVPSARQHVARLTALLFLGLALAAAAVSSPPRFLGEPRLVPNPNPRVPLAVLLQFEAEGFERLRLDIRDGTATRSLTFAATDQPADGLPILGLRPGTHYQVNVVLQSRNGAEEHSAPAALEFTTAPLPGDSREWPAIKIARQPDAALEPGITLLSVRRNAMARPFRMTRAERRFTEDWGLILGLDSRGDVVWYYRSEQRVAGIDRLDNGNIIFHTADFRTVEIDMLGNIVRQFYPEQRPWGPVENAIPIEDIQTLHHQPHQVISGNFLAFSSNERTIENYYTSEFDADAPRATQQVNGDTVIEFDEQGNVVWSWNAFEHLDVFRVGYDLTNPYWWVRGFPGNLDWTHGNGISYDPDDDAVIIYLKHQDAALKIDRASKEIVWIFGEPTDWPERLQSKLLTRKGDFPWPYHAHNPRLTDRGTLILYENGQWGARPFTGREPLSPNEAFSRAAEYRIDEQAMTVKEIWTSHTQRSEDTCHAPGMGDAHVLPVTGNILVVDPVCFDQENYPLTYVQQDFSRHHIMEMNHHARIRQYSATQPASVLSEILIHDPYKVIHWQVYGGLQIDSLYPDSLRPAREETRR